MVSDADLVLYFSIQRSSVLLAEYYRGANPNTPRHETLTKLLVENRSQHIVHNNCYFYGIFDQRMDKKESSRLLNQVKYALDRMIESGSIEWQLQNPTRLCIQYEFDLIFPTILLLGSNSDIDSDSESGCGWDSEFELLPSLASDDLDGLIEREYDQCSQLLQNPTDLCIESNYQSISQEFMNLELNSGSNPDMDSDSPRGWDSELEQPLDLDDLTALPLLQKSATLCCPSVYNQEDMNTEPNSCSDSDSDSDSESGGNCCRESESDSEIFSFELSIQLLKIIVLFSIQLLKKKESDQETTGEEDPSTDSLFEGISTYVWIVLFVLFSAQFFVLTSPVV